MIMATLPSCIAESMSPAFNVAGMPPHRSTKAAIDGPWTRIFCLLISAGLIAGRPLDKITVDPNPPPYPDRFPHHHGATVTITLKDGRQFSDHVDFPRGSAPRGIEWADVDAKYRRLVPLSGLAPEKVEASLEVIHEFETVKAMSELVRLLT